MYSRTQILTKISDIMQELFEIPDDKIRPETRLYEDLDLDSIDAVDLIVRLQEYMGQRVEPSDFKGVRTINDVIQVVETLLNNNTLINNEK
jgi:acyl carrier protein